jgi:hypothetical protein
MVAFGDFEAYFEGGFVGVADAFVARKDFVSEVSGVGGGPL